MAWRSHGRQSNQLSVVPVHIDTPLNNQRPDFSTESASESLQQVWSPCVALVEHKCDEPITPSNGPGVIFRSSGSSADKDVSSLSLAVGTTTDSVASRDRVDRRRDVMAARRAQANAVFGSGIHLFWDKRYEAAADCFRRARELDPTLTSPSYFLALTYARQGDHRWPKQLWRRQLNWRPHIPLRIGDD
jgi:hypothetical protein